jgi:hypothetical protein
MAHTRRPRAGGNERFARLGWTLLGAVLCAAFAWRVWPFSVDDAFIVARYAGRLGAGLGYAFQPGAASDGVTGPLWLFLLALGVKLGCDPILTGKLLGVGCSLAACFLVLRQSWQRSGGARRAPVLVALLATSAPLWIWAIGGLETALATLCVTLCACGALARPAPRLAWVGSAALLIPWLRPELEPLALVLLIGCALRRPKQGLWLSAYALAGLASVLLFRRLSFGHYLPLSAFAKPASLAHGLEYVLICLRSPASLALLPLLALAFARARRADRGLLLAIALHASVVVFAGGDWMKGARLFVPIVPVTCFVAALGWERLFVRRRVPALVLALLVVALRGFAAFTDGSAARASGELRERRLPALLTALRDVAEPIAVLDIGALGYFTGKRLLDLGGLTEARIAYAAGGHIAKRIDSAWLRAHAPGAFLLHSRVAPRIDGEGHVRWFAGYPVERHVLGFSWVLREYRVREVIRYDRDYFYLLLTRGVSATP